MANWTTLFASPADCECEDCNSVFSPAAYLVDIMQYLDHCDSKGAGSKSVLQVLFKRRPDIGNLLLTCENTNTEIPYIDLVNEIMEYYVVFYDTASKGLPAPTVPPDPNLAHDTGNATAEELKAEPQYILMDAYKQVYQKVYPFNLPYHQPLNVIRAYLQFLKTSRAELMEVFGKNPPNITSNAIPQAAIDAEWVQLSLNEYEVLTGEDFSGASKSPQANIEGYFGNPSPQYTGNGIPVVDFLHRTGLQYTDLLAILEAKFINPGQDAYNVLQNLLFQTSISAQSFYNELKNNNWNADNAFLKVLSDNKIQNFGQWLADNFENFQKTITIYECTLNQDGQCTSACDIDNMLLHSIQWLYEKDTIAGFTSAKAQFKNRIQKGFSDPGKDMNVQEFDDTTTEPAKSGFLSRFHRFIRLWRKTGWSIHELDNMIVVLGKLDNYPADKIDTTLIHNLAFVTKVNAILNLPLIELACIWGDIDTYGDNSVNFPKNISLYAQLFLTSTGKVSSSGTQLPNIFAINPLNQYLVLSGSIPQIADHLPEIFAALAISADDYNAIIADAKFTDDNVSVPNLSLFYRYKLLANALNLNVVDLCTLKSANCFNVDPFSSPDNTFDFIQKVQKFQDAQTTQSSLSVPLLNYILSGSSKPINNIALPQDTILKLLPGLRSALLKIDDDNPQSDVNIITSDLLSKKLMSLYSKDITNQFILMLQSSIPPVLPVVVPDQSYTITDTSKYAYKITLIYSSPNGQFQLNETITDSNGSTAQIVSISDSKLTLKNITLNGSNQSLEGSIRGGTSNATATVVSFTILFQLTGFMTDDEYNKIISSVGLSLGFKTETDNLYQQSLAALNQGSTVVAPQVICIVPTDPKTIFSIPATLSPKYSYSQSGTSWLLQCKGIMSDDEHSQLKNQGNVQFKSAVNYIYNYSSTFLQNNFTGLYNSSSINDALKKLFGLSGNPINDLTGKLQYFYTSFLPFLTAQLKKRQTVSWLSLLINLDVQSVSAITNSNLSTLIQAASEKGLDAYYSNNPALPTDPQKKIDTEINFSWGINPPVTSTTFSIQWKGWFSPVTDGDYIFTVITADTSDLVNLLVNGLKNDMNSVVTLIGGQLYTIELNYTHTSGNSGVQLFWQSVTMPQSIVDTQFLYPDTCVQTLLQQILLYHRAAQAVTGFGLSALEVSYFITHGPDFGNINFLSLTGVQWQRLYDYNTLKKTIPANLLLLIFQQASTEDKSSPGALPSNNLILNIANANKPNWNKDYLSYLAGNSGDSSVNPVVSNVNSYFGYKVADFKNEIALLQIKKAMDLAIKTKMPVNSSGLPAWTLIEADLVTSVDVLHLIAVQIKNAVKAKYKDNWLTIATQLNNPIRENQKQALISYLLTLQLPAPDGMGSDGSGIITDADGLFEYLLIDAQMTAAVVTSRLIQTTLAVQLFADRCLLGVETDEVPLISNAINPDEWEWMKHYSVAAGLKKLFVYVENYLDPSLRDDKSPFFLDFESAIKKGDITDENVENAFRDYLSKLNEVSNMELCGMYNDTDTQTLYVFARTHAAPYNYYFRKATNTSAYDAWIWSPWEQVQLDIKSIDDGAYSGVHLMPVIWKKRLFLFWPEFMEKTDTSKNANNENSNNDLTYSNLANTTPNDSMPLKYWEIRLGWSEYANGKWVPKKLSKEVLSYPESYDIDPYLYHVDPYLYFFQLAVLKDVLTLSLSTYTYGQDGYPYVAQLSKFIITDIHEKITTHNFPSSDKLQVQYFSNFESVEYDVSSLVIDTVSFLQNDTTYKLLFSNDVAASDFENNINYPFFYTDAINKKSYFVTPIPPYQKRLLEIVTTFINENDGTWQLMANNDLAFIKTSNTPSGHVEVHIASGSSNYQDRILDTATTFLNETDGIWQLTANNDLAFIKTSNTPSGHVEVHIASGSSNYQDRILDTATTFLNENDGIWQLTSDNDLVFIKTSNTPSGYVEVHIASGSSNYQDRILDTATTFLNENDGIWQPTSDNDLVLIKTSNTPSGYVEVHIASGSSNYQDRILETVTTFINENDGTWQLTSDNDLAFIKTSNTPSGYVEVHIASK